MAVSTDSIRNVALLGHQSAGKTTLAEAMIFNAGQTKRRGTIGDGSTRSDYHPEEQERGMSIFTSMLHFDWKGRHFNVLDTPGYPDFSGEVIAALQAADAAVFVMHAGEGVQVGTELAWQYADALQKPSMFVINHMDDRGDASFRDLVAQIQNRFGRGAVIVQIDAGAGSRTVIDVLLMKQLTFAADGSGTYTESDIAPEFKEEADALHNALVEAIAENDAALMDTYFENGTLSEDEMRAGLVMEMAQRDLFPIFVTSAEQNIGVTRLMDFIGNVCPSPAEVHLESGRDVQADASAPPVAFVWHTMSEPHVGDFSYLRVVQGTLRTGQDLENAQTGVTERLGTLYRLNGHEREAAEELVAGDLGAVVKLKNTHTNNTLRQKGEPGVVEGIHFPEPRHVVAAHAAKSGEEDKLAQGLHALHEEDPTLTLTQDPHLGQTLLGGQGELHLDLAKQRLKSRFGVELAMDKPKISYRETLQTQARTSYRHKKQTGGAGQFADISVLVEPIVEGVPFAPPEGISVRGTETHELPWGATLELVDGIVGGVIDMRRFSGAILKGVMEAMQRGPVAGYPVGNVRVVIFDGGMHAVDSNENAFKTAARMAFRDAFRSARPVLMEPVHRVEITVPESHVGDVMGDLNTRRGRIQGIEAEGFFQKITAHVPEAELYRYATHLRSLTQGRGLHAHRTDHYDAMPRTVQDKVVAEATHAHDDED